jgi:hypothetical protein
MIYTLDKVSFNKKSIAIKANLIDINDENRLKEVVEIQKIKL